MHGYLANSDLLGLVRHRHRHRHRHRRYRRAGLRGRGDRPRPPARGVALVKSASLMPWFDPLAMAREDNTFRYGKDPLPAAEGVALWAEFDREMDGSTRS
jgi:hypothetical protein